MRSRCRAARGRADTVPGSQGACHCRRLRDRPIICITKLSSIARRVWGTRPIGQPWQAFQETPHIDIPQRDEPAETALLMRCSSISSFARGARPSAAVRHRRIEHDDVESAVAAARSRVAASCAAMALSLSEIDASSAAQNTEHSADHAATGPRRPSARVRPFERLTPSSP